MNGLVKAAEEFAVERHEGQRYGTRGLLPYTHHLLHAGDVAFRFRVTEPAKRAAIWLHDVVEDTDTEIEEIESRFGARVARLVDAVTDRPGKNRAARHEATYPRIRATPGATVIKLCDRIANVEHSIYHGSRQTGMYVKEHAGFIEALYRKGFHEPMWEHLDACIAAAIRQQDFR